LLQPTAVALALVLLAEAVAAQPPPARERREQHVTVTGLPGAPVTEIHVALDVVTVLLFDADIRRDAVLVDRARVKLIDTGARSIILAPVVELGADERVILQVSYADEKAPAQVVFALVAHPSEVDTRVEVARHEQSVSTCQAELAEARAQCSTLSPARWVREGRLDERGVTARHLNCRHDRDLDGLYCEGATVYVAGTWALLVVKGHNLPGHPPWSPREATLTTKRGSRVPKVRGVESEPTQLAPGEVGWVFVELAAPLTSAPEPFQVTLTDPQGGRSLVVQDVSLSAGKEDP
jgi:uncharacterized protein (TIGR02268 family)